MATFGTYCRLGVSVHATNVQVIRATRKRFRPDWAIWLNCYREARHATYREMLAYHREQQALCREFRL
jgi:hypothetical protein